MSGAAHTPGPWIFEPHNAFGTTFLGEQWPFGYISTAHPPVPIFGMDPVLEYSVGELEANARLIAAAPDLLAALEWLHLGKGKPVDVAAAIAKARGEA